MTDAQTARQRPSNLLSSLLLFGTVLLLLVLGISVDSLSPSVKLGGVTVLTLLAAFWWLGHRGKMTAAFHVSRPILVPLLAFYILQTILVLRAPLLRPSFEAELQALFLLLFFLFVLSSLNGPWRQRTWEDALILIAVALGAVESILIVAWLLKWWQISGGQPLVPPASYRATGLLLGHPNVLAGFIGLVLPIVLIRIISARDTPSRFQRSLLFGFLLVILFFTSSRGGWVASALGISVSAGLFILARSKGIADAVSGAVHWLRSRPWWQLALGAIVVIGLVYVAAWQVSRTGHAPIARARLPVWGAAWKIFLDDPVLGHGPGSFPMLYALTSSYRELDIPHAHNLLLQVLDESGAVGLIALIWLLIGVAIVSLRGWRRADAEGQGTLAAYAGAGATLLSHNMIDFLFGPPLYTAAAFVLLALGLQAARVPVQGSSRPPARIGPLLTLCVVLPTGLLICLRGAWAYWNGVSLARAGRWESAAETLCANGQMAVEPLYAESCALARAQVEGSRLSDATTSIFSSAVSSDPYWGFHWANLSLALWSDMDPSGAMADMERAQLAMPSESTLAVMRGYFAESLEGLDQARVFYRQALSDNPWLARDAFFGGGHTSRRPPDLATLDAEMTKDSRLLWQAGLSIDAGQPERALPLIEQAERVNPRNPMIYALRAEYDLAAGNADGAWHSAQIGRFIDEDNLPLAVLSAQAAERRADYDSARTGLTAAANLIRSDTRSQRYYYSAYNRYSLPIDRVPTAFRAAPAPGLLDLLTRAIHDPNWTAGSQPGQTQAWTEAAMTLTLWR